MYPAKYQTQFHLQITHQSTKMRMIHNKINNQQNNNLSSIQYKN